MVLIVRCVAEGDVVLLVGFVVEGSRARTKVLSYCSPVGVMVMEDTGTGRRDLMG